jgi:hypothetical protein
MKTYEALFNKKQTKGVYGISLVENPAMQGMFIALSENEIVKFASVDNDKRLICGLVLRADFPVFRKGAKEDYNIVFSAETIRDLAHNFYESNHQSNSSIEHLKKIDGVTFVESWIVENPRNDKATELKLDAQKGDWFTIMKIDNDEVWNDYQATGKVKGFSIDAMLELKEIINFKNDDMDVSKIVDAIKNGFASLNFGSVKSADESVAIEFDGDTMTVGGDVWVLDNNGDKVPLPIGEYQLEGAKILVVSELGKIGEVKDEVVAQQEVPSGQNSEPMSDAKQTAEIATAVENAIKSIMIKYSNDIESVKKNNLELQAQILELSKQPASQPITVQPKQKETFSYTNNN